MGQGQNIWLDNMTMGVFLSKPGTVLQEKMLFSQIYIMKLLKSKCIVLSVTI